MDYACQCAFGLLILRKMFGEFAVIGIFLFFALMFIFVNLLMGKILRPSHPNAVKGMNYECGEEPIGGAWVRFNNRFYIVALIFVIFEVELAAILPVAVVLRRWVEEGDPAKDARIALAEMLLFIGILFLGLVYAWVKGDLEWVRPKPRIRWKPKYLPATEATPSANSSGVSP